MTVQLVVAVGTDRHGFAQAARQGHDWKWSVGLGWNPSWIEGDREMEKGGALRSLENSSGGIR